VHTNVHKTREILASIFGAFFFAVDIAWATSSALLRISLIVRALISVLMRVLDAKTSPHSAQSAQAENLPSPRQLSDHLGYFVCRQGFKQDASGIYTVSQHYRKLCHTRSSLCKLVNAETK
jgi:hypothetical protein